MKFDKDTRIGEVVAKAPEKIDILLSIGMHCVGCPASLSETIEEACMVHGIDYEEVLEELNKETPKDEENSDDDSENESTENVED